MWKRISPYFPFLFLAYLFGYLFWQLVSLSSMTNWLDHSGKIIWNIKHVDRHLMEMRNDVRVYQFTHNEEQMKTYQESKEKLLKTMEDLRALTANDGQDAKMLALFEED